MAAVKIVFVPFFQNSVSPSDRDKYRSRSRTPEMETKKRKKEERDHVSLPMIRLSTAHCLRADTSSVFRYRIAMVIRVTKI